MNIQFSANHIFLVGGYTDMRKSIDGLSATLSQQFNANLFSSSLFLFCGRKRDRLKILLWQGDGFILLYKRLENGKFQWPRNNYELTKLTPQQYRWLMEGLAIHQPKAVKQVYPRSSIQKIGIIKTAEITDKYWHFQLFYDIIISMIFDKMK